MPVLGLYCFKENPMCGRNFGNLLIPALAGMLVAETMTPPQTVARQAGSQAVCPQCKTAVSPAFGWCPQCGQVLRAQSAKIQSCTYCGQAMTSGAQYCAFCGAPAGKR
jgi:RNA polymerase subunit RPABC4/transcription elongation factor Spt4